MINLLKTEELKLVSEWDKTFTQSEKVDYQKSNICKSLWNHTRRRFI